MADQGCCCAQCVRTQEGESRKSKERKERGRDLKMIVDVRDATHSIFLSLLLLLVGIVEDLGQFKTLLDPGFHCLLWPITTIVGRLVSRISLTYMQCGMQA